MNFESIKNNMVIGIYAAVIVLVWNMILDYLSKGLDVNIFSFIGVLVVLSVSIFSIGYLLNKIVLSQHYK